MIPKNEIEEACDQCCNFGLGLKVHNDTLKRSLFKAGVSFAEKELENLAVEFYNWMQQYQDLSAAIRINEVENFKELFEEFKKEKYGTKSN